MISKAQARINAKAYLEERNRDFLEIVPAHEVYFAVAEKVLYGMLQGQKRDMYVVEYQVPWGMDDKTMRIHVDAITGVVHYTLGPTTWVEEWENFEEDFGEVDN